MGGGSEQSTWIEKLPSSIAIDILSRLPITSLQQCKSVSRIWNSTAKDPLLVHAHLSRAPTNSLFIMLYTDFPRSTLDLVHIEGPDRYTNAPKQLAVPFHHLLPYFDVFTSCNGLVCLSNLLEGHLVYIYNPIGRRFRELPRVPTRSDLSVFSVVFGFGFHPVSECYKVVVMVYYTETDNFYSGVSPEAEGYVIGLGCSEWRHIGGVEYQVGGPTSEALVGGRLHWLTKRHGVDGVKQQDIVSFDLDTEVFDEVPRPGLNLDWSNYHIVELGGCLSAVVRNQDKGHEIWSMKEYDVKESWVKEFVIADYIPRDFSINSMPPARARRSGTSKRAFRVLCKLQNGEILFAYRCRRLVTYDPKSEEFKDLEFVYLPVEFETCVHIGSLVSVDAAFGM